MTDDTKKCPYCAETIKAAAVVCRYCGRDLVGQPRKAAEAGEKPKGLSWGCIILVVIVGLIIVVVAVGAQLGWFTSSSRPYRSMPTSAPSSYLVKYKVTGSGIRADVTYENAQGGTEQSDIRIPWEQTLTMKSGSFVYLSTQSGDDATRTITCEIWVAGKLYKTSTSSGRYVIATCSGSVGGD